VEVCVSLFSLGFGSFAFSYSPDGRLWWRYAPLHIVVDCNCSRNSITTLSDSLCKYFSLFVFKYSRCAVQAMEAVEVEAMMTVEAEVATVEEVMVAVAVEDMAEVEDVEEDTAVQVVVVVRRSWVLFYFLRSTKCLMIALASEMQATAVDTMIAAAAGDTVAEVAATTDTNFLFVKQRERSKLLLFRNMGKVRISAVAECRLDLTSGSRTRSRVDSVMCHKGFPGFQSLRVATPFRIFLLVSDARVPCW
jgi:hypothetical protein